MRFDLPAQPLESALAAFGSLTGYSVLVASTVTQGRQAAAVHGDFVPSEALRRLLTDTRLSVRYSGRSAFTLVPESPGDEAGSAPTASREETGRDSLSGRPPYAAALQAAITGALCRAHPDMFGRYRTAIQLWVDPDGRVRQVRLLESSGMKERDVIVLRELRKLVIDVPPPPGRSLPVTVLLSPRPDPAADCRPFAAHAD